MRRELGDRRSSSSFMSRFSKGVESVDDDSEGEGEDRDLWVELGVSGESGGVVWGDNGCCRGGMRWLWRAGRRREGETCSSGANDSSEPVLVLPATAICLPPYKWLIAGHNNAHLPHYRRHCEHDYPPSNDVNRTR